MGVDYTGHFGMGVKIKKVLGTFDCLYDDLDDSHYEFFEVGSGAYTGNENDFYVKVKTPIHTALDFQIWKKRLLEHLKEIDLEPDGEFGAVGGLEIH